MAADSASSTSLRLGILASGSGSNVEAIATAVEEGRLSARIAVLICNRADAGAVAKAKRHAIPVRIIPHDDFRQRGDFDKALADALEESGVDLVVMAGFDRLVTGALLDRYPGRVVNIHPALLPAFKGSSAQSDAAAYGVKMAGATVHFVDEHMDHGPIIAQVAVVVASTDDAETVRKRILKQEHRLYPHALQLYAEGRLRIDGRCVVITDEPTADPTGLFSPPLPS